MQDKWNVRKGYLKIHIVVDTKSKKILSMKVTDEHVHDKKMLPKLVADIAKSKKSITLFGRREYGKGNDANSVTV